MEKEITNERYDVVYEVVAKWMRQHATKFKKKHGNWLVLYAPKNQVIYMDTWNGHVAQAHCKEPRLDDGYISGVKATHTYASPRRNYDNKSYDKLDQVVDIYKTLLTVPA